MKIGKITADQLQNKVLNEIKYKKEEVLVHAGIGEDSAVVDFGEEVLVVSSDPITGAVENIGYLAVHINCNDLAAAGARPVGLEIVLLLPESKGEEDISKIMRRIHNTAAELEVEILGGHTEILSTIEKPLVIVTGIGKADKDKYIATGNAQTDDDIILTKGMGIEGTYILASDYKDYLLKKGVDKKVIENGAQLGKELSVLTEGRIAAENGANSLHDITEGGLFGALEELSAASEKGFVIQRANLHAKTATSKICEILKLDPTALLSSGSMLITAPEKYSKKIIKKLKKKGIDSWIIGKIKEEKKLIQKEDGELIEFSWSKRDELWKFMEQISEEV